MTLLNFRVYMKCIIYLGLGFSGLFIIYIGPFKKVIDIETEFVEEWLDLAGM